jgi:hypothetical protein
LLALAACPHQAVKTSPSPACHPAGGALKKQTRQIMDVYQTINHQFKLIEESRKIIRENRRLIESTESENTRKILRNQIAYHEGIIRVARAEINQLTRTFLWALNNPLAEKVEMVKEPVYLDRKFIGVADINSDRSMDIELGSRELVLSMKSAVGVLSWKITNPHIIDSMIAALQEGRDQVFGTEAESEA